MLDIVILSVGFMIHMWTLPYPFKDWKADTVIRIIQITFGLTILITFSRSALNFNVRTCIAGFGVGFACFLFHIVYNQGIRLTAKEITPRFLLSQVLILGVQIPAEEFLYRGVFFTVLNNLWGPGTALIFSTALSIMLWVTTSRNPLYWLGAAIVGIFCGLGYYYSGNIWSSVLIRALSDIGLVTLNEKRSYFT